MKILFLIRHAKTEQLIFGYDFDRKLLDRGRNDANAMSRLLKSRYSVDTIISSNAKRAEQTAQIFADNSGLAGINFIPSLYHAAPAVYENVLLQIDDRFSNAAIIGHNNGISYFATELLDHTIHIDMPTAAVVAIRADCTHWSDFLTAKKELLFFEWPHKENS